MSLLRGLWKAVLALVALVTIVIGGYLAYAWATAAGRVSFPDIELPKIAAAMDPASIERGRYLVYGPAHCAACHSVDDRDHPELVVPGLPLSGGLVFELGPLARSQAANLTPDPETGIGKRTDAELARTLRTSVLHDGTLSFLMRFSAAELSDEDLAAVIGFLRAQPPVKKAWARTEWKLLGRALLPILGIAPKAGSGPKGVAPGAEPTTERGKYLVEHVALCGSCHTAFDMQKLVWIGPTAGGGLPDPSHGSDADMEFVAPNLTSDPSGYTGRVEEEEFIKRLRGGRAIASSIMPWESFKTLTDVDARSIYRYLKTLPPVRNDLGPSYRKKGWKKGG